MIEEQFIKAVNTFSSIECFGYHKQTILALQEIIDGLECQTRIVLLVTGDVKMIPPNCPFTTVNGISESVL